MTKLSTDYPQIAAERESAARRHRWIDATMLGLLIVVSLPMCGAALGIVGGFAWHVGAAVVRWLS